MPKPNEKNRRTSKPIGKRLLPWAILVVIVFAVGLVIGTLTTRTSEQETRVAAGPAEQTLREIILYFASVDGQVLHAETARINECTLDEDCLRDTIQALIAGPQGDLVPILPAQTRLLGVNIEESLVKLDFSQDLISAHPGGTQSELLTVYGLADTLATNFPHLRSMQVLVDGTPVETLKGHVDLRQPVFPDFSFVEEGDAPIGRLPVGVVNE